MRPIGRATDWCCRKKRAANGSGQSAWPGRNWVSRQKIHVFIANELTDRLRHRRSARRTIRQIVEKGGNIVGIGITVPHKIAVIPHLDRVTQVAK
ncbi:hypothetical protein EB235_31720 [Mesorhizobium loti R88b]|uniref:Uncharacterized protein n=1 Tax=Mesorhizobium loti R88b TaxID=935548 RepID=A0A6M7WTG1_RHILI|nr:hypothetical protein EB235_31720 [Mesorhizobium loti R88b]